MRCAPVLFTFLLLASALPAAASEPKRAPVLGMANPASVYCIQKGGKLEIRKTPDGAEYGMCQLPDGTEIEEWTFFRKDHEMRQEER